MSRGKSFHSFFSCDDNNGKVDLLPDVSDSVIGEEEDECDGDKLLALWISDSSRLVTLPHENLHFLSHCLHCKKTALHYPKHTAVW